MYKMSAIGHFFLLKLEGLFWDCSDDILTWRGLQDPRVLGGPLNSSRHSLSALDGVWIIGMTSHADFPVVLAKASCSNADMTAVNQPLLLCWGERSFSQEFDWLMHTLLGMSYRRPSWLGRKEFTILRGSSRTIWRGGKSRKKNFDDHIRTI